MSDQQNTGGSNILLMMGLLAACLVVVVGGGYALWSYYAAPPPEVSRVNLTRVGGTTQVSAQEQPDYRELLRESNARGAQTAAASNQSFIASIPLQQDVVTPTETPKAAPVVAPREVPRSQSSGRTPEQEKALNEARQKSLAVLLAKMQVEPGTGDLPSTQLLGGKESGWASWRDSLPGSYVQQAAVRSRQDAANTPPATIVVAPFWRGPGKICTGVDSDNGATPVLGCITTGQYAGAVLKAPEGAKLSGDGVIIHFTTMTLNGQAYKVDAYALDDKSLVANIATDVDHHYFRRIVLPSVFGGASEAGQLYAQSNTQVLSNGFNAVTARPGLPDPTAVAGVIAGGMAQRAGQVLTNDAARLPDRTVWVDNGEVVAIQFMSAVYSTDALPPQGATPSAGSTATPVTVSNNPTPTAADLRAETQARIRAAEQRGIPRE
ncbi:intracellular multiplication protein IcmE [Kosakonia radicincitans]|uniref:Intracellular multiplication protein IcmE n=2 Tax=Kosakonia radicincitans TaxID=283686 RepID=A0AAX2EZC3_9ENTR|nr:intracellular multiplication protein IcmE [Kosakonia radicincitans]SFR26245.1 intracellular multiplication protein IcmE [Kosakonia radicincitans]SFU16745.1 intracellular multiplication protein IcmE [Kosakonia radicincitans]SFY32028.1 intracellular multiplication protein IcmE [Kosakonia radicincitans]